MTVDAIELEWVDGDFDENQHRRLYMNRNNEGHGCPPIICTLPASIQDDTSNNLTPRGTKELIGRFDVD